MDFTREPIIETVITPREGYRLVVRSSKGAGSEEHFVDALEVVSFGSGIFFRSLERPKPFIVPVADYEVLEVREPRMVLKTPSEHGAKVPTQRLKAVDPQKAEAANAVAAVTAAAPQDAATAATADGKAEKAGDRNDRRRDRRRGFRRRRGGRDEAGRPEGEEASGDNQEPQSADAQAQNNGPEEESKVISSTPMLSSILPPPTMLIRDDLKRLREDYKGAFYINDDKDEDDSTLSSLGTTSDDETNFSETPYRVSESDIRMNEGGDSEVSQDASFCPSPVEEEANSSPAQDVQ
ncbi:MAG: hypothetical protein LLF94_04640 [Chlamydiales bacterium]|nr:hypothetical protein [Chlamydiales bacterium]